MLHFFYTYYQLPNIKISGATQFQILSAERYRGQIIPFSCLYVTSNPYFRKIKENLPEIDQSKLKTMNASQAEAVKAHNSFPIELKSLGENAVNSIQTTFEDKEDVNIVVINGIGSGFGDNYVGLGAMQRLQILLAPLKVNFHLMQRTNIRVAPVYMRESNIYLHNNCMSLKAFFKMDYFVNLTGMLGLPEFDKLPLLHFMARSFQVNSQSSIEQLQPKLTLDPVKLNSLQYAIKSHFKQQTRPIVLFHPQASSPVRSIKKVFADGIISSLIAHGFNVISAIPYDFTADEFASFDELSNDIDDLLHIAACSDAVVSVGTVLYHLAAALDKPTILLPSVRADYESGQILPNVKAWVPEDSKALIIDKHKSRDEEDMAVAEQIWKNINPQELSVFLLNMLART